MHHHHTDPYRDSTGADESYYMHASSDDYERAGSHKDARSQRIKRFVPLIARTCHLSLHLAWSL